MPALAPAARRLLDRLERRLADPALADPDTVHRALLDGLAPALGLVGACWHLTDPATGCPRAGGEAGDPPGSFEESFQYEYRRPDVARFTDLYRRGVTVTSIGAETRGRRADSARFREMVAPAGAADELRIAVADRFGVWSAVVLFSERPLEPGDLQLVAVLVPAAAAALRRTLAGGDIAEPDGDGPAVAIVSGDDRVLAADAVARVRLEALARMEARAGSLPGVAHFLAARARLGDAARAQARDADGRWLALAASRLDEAGTGAVSLVLQPAPVLGVLDALLRAHGLTAREREVAALAAEGAATKVIAQRLGVSRHTAADHLKAALAKTGADSRGGLLELVRAT